MTTEKQEEVKGEDVCDGIKTTVKGFKKDGIVHIASIKHDDLCENCGKPEKEHHKGLTIWKSCKKFKAKTSLDKKSKEGTFNLSEKIDEWGRYYQIHGGRMNALKEYVKKAIQKLKADLAQENAYNEQLMGIIYEKIDKIFGKNLSGDL